MRKYDLAANGQIRTADEFTHPTGFDPADLRTSVRLWHGDDDETVGVPMGRHLAAALPDCEATFVPGEGHMLCLIRWAEIIGAFA